MTDGTPAGDRPAGRPVREQRPAPARPPLTSTLPPPAPRAAPRRAGAVRASAWCWGGAALAGLVALTAAALDLAGVRRRLEDAGAAVDPSATEQLLRTGADTTIAGVLGGVAALLVLSCACLALFLHHRPGWRSAFVVLGLLALGADVLALDLLSGGPEVDRSAIAVHGGLVVLALALLALPSSRAWARSAR